MNINLITIGNGSLAITHRPKLKEMPSLKAEGATHLVTLLAEHEGAQQLGNAAMDTGLAWLWIPLRNADVPDEAQSKDLLAALREVADVLNRGGRAVIHCSAGIHRTGMFTYALLRQLGQDTEGAMATLRALRQVTAAGVGEDRIAWGDGLASGNNDR